MKNLKFMALLLAGSLAVASAPAYTWATENNANEETAVTEETTAEGTTIEETTTEETTTKETTTEELTEEPAAEENTQEQTDEQNVEEEIAVTSDEEAQPIDNTVPEGATDTETGIVVNKEDGTTGAYSFKTLKDAVDYASSLTVADDKTPVVTLDATKLTSDVTITETISITSGKVCITAKGGDVKIVRANTNGTPSKYDGTMFSVNGTDSQLQFKAEDGASLTINGTISDKETATGSIVDVSNGAKFGITSNNVTLTGNNAPNTDGGAINNNGGTIVFVGGTISGNIGNKGAVYSNSNIEMSGSVYINDNFQEDPSIKANLYLAQDKKIIVKGEIVKTENIVPKISLNFENPSEGMVVVTKSNDVTTEQFKAASGYFVLDDESKYKTNFDETNSQITLKTVDEPVNADFNYTYSEASWSDHLNVTIGNFKSNKEASVKLFLVKSSEVSESTIKSKAESTTATEKITSSELNSDKKFTYTFADDDSEEDYVLVVWADFNDGSESQYCTVDLNRSGTIMKKRPWGYIEKIDASNITVSSDRKSVSVKEFYATANIDYYYFFVSSDTAVNESLCESMLQNGLTKYSAERNKSFTLELTGLSSKTTKAVIYGIPKAGGSNIFKTIDFANVIPKKTYNVSESTVNGLSSPITFWPMGYLKPTLWDANSTAFEVIGIGMDNTDPMNGDERWNPNCWYDDESDSYLALWSMKNSLSDIKADPKTWANHKFIINSKKGISEAKNYTMYVFFEKEVYNATTGKWERTGTIESKAVPFTSKGYTHDELLAWMAGFTEDEVDPSYDYADGVTAAELTQAAVKSGATSKSSANTADETPIGAMSAMAAASLLCAGFVFMRKRKQQ